MNQKHSVSSNKSCTFTNLVCKLTSPELQEYKATVIKKLKDQVLEKQELHNGFAFKFEGSDEVLTQLTEFIRTERNCCDFFVFDLTVWGDQSEMYLQITGPEGVKEFMNQELGF